ncbi:MAG: hypothetical protein A3F84_20695 [Candidatus Handelsmanbacteria bacterium RIFCSPLOWO2_12_FULL_64_10]|uniref:Uncharacterized protein n=1 Tax=Handelsmanbacteria sp. (strain RIFCSPLOWO2_12_FULL_64_10) TaxID=1817868 RepID=A0A1F6CSW9_HANXR|nr:MAG: hypothetical protein A3F84_20695 [Candidatus Handelsmanbacteria bacterium RIFCSPLOWO2_12_FULL_64_10]
MRQSRQTYLIATYRGNKVADDFIASNEMGWFCGRCPTVVINPSEVRQFLQYSLPHWDVGDEFVMAGIVNLDAVPEDKHELPLGEDDNPIPLVLFTNVSDGLPEPSQEGHARLVSARKRKKAKNKKHKRRR